MSKLLTKKNQRINKYKQRCIEYAKKSDSVNVADVGFNTEHDTMDESREQTTDSTADYSGSPTSTNTVDPFGTIRNPQLDLVFGGDAVFHNKMPIAASSGHLSDIGAIFKHTVQSPDFRTLAAATSELAPAHSVGNIAADESHELATGDQQAENECNAPNTDLRNGVSSLSNPGMLSKFSYLIRSNK